MDFPYSICILADMAGVTGIIGLPYAKWNPTEVGQKGSEYFGNFACHIASGLAAMADPLPDFEMPAEHAGLINTIY